MNKLFSEIDKQLKLTKAKFLAGKREKFKNKWTRCLNI